MSTSTPPAVFIRRVVATTVVAWLAGAQGLAAQVEVVPDATVYFGSSTNASAPATFDLARVRGATPEWRCIVREGVRRGSARYRLLMSDMHRRMRAAIGCAAVRLGRDLVVAACDLADPRGRQVHDLTADVIRGL